MPNFQDLSQLKFGRLTIIGRSENRGTRTSWNCKCDCGSVISVTSNQLKRGRTKSCGCLRRETAAQRAMTHGHGYECR